ncbi:MAG: 30S ribosomal protein S6 [Lentisphaerae bacterium]|nr:30S ribosomal protein S6 [Lentisphaerota bacterium]MBT4816444.1 30S ribosomal protein S6 [Lentisphaerota bacterium]MBT5606771.1 30S ribosomal protein S6 [Lentisphaerota bacterium]MBT7061567.1 30S ribosomal protein S6 [Lentisphaerota bacterium]MBT7843882.1 30S ribosomal protein S6 [Lentisphaerota bacterium]
MRTYEAVFILDSRKLEDDGDAFARGIAKHAKSLGGQVKQRISMGRRQFASPIRKLKAGVYWDFVLDLDPAQVAPFKEHYRLNERVLRVEVLDYDEASQLSPAELSRAPRREYRDQGRGDRDRSDRGGRSERSERY